MMTAQKLLLSAISLTIALIPVWFFVFIKHLLAPQGFWQNLIVYGIGWWFLAGFQFFFLILLIAALFAIWENK